MRFPLKSLALACSLIIAAGPRAQAQTNSADEPEATGMIALTPEALGDALSCRSHGAAGAFASAFFLEGKPPAWMRETRGEKDTEGMFGLYGYRLSKPVFLLGHEVERVYFLKNWVVTLWPRAEASAFIQQQKMERAPIRIAEQYFRFIDPESGPMLGVFEPTGGSTAAMLAKAFGANPPPTLPTPPSESLFVGCNYAAASQKDFLEAASQAEAMMDKAARDIGEAAGTDKSQ